MPVRAATTDVEGSLREAEALLAAGKAAAAWALLSPLELEAAGSPDFDYLYRHRHLLYGPFVVYRRHRGYAILVLSGPLQFESGIYQDITSRQDMLGSRGVIEALNALYLDRSGIPASVVPASTRTAPARITAYR